MEGHDSLVPPGDAFGKPRRSWLGRRIGAAGAAIVALLAKLKAVLLLLGNIKLLTTAGTALVSVGAYSLIWGWEFALGFVLLLFVHEMGHVVALRREGIKASAPLFIPFLGAMIGARSLGDNALAEARVGLAGPLLGTLAAAVVAAIGLATGSGAPRGARLHRLPAQPLQPVAGRAARRRARDGGDGALDVVPRLRRDRPARLPHAEPDPPDHHAVRGL